MKLALALLIALAASAYADPTAARTRHEQGQKLYNLGKFAEAIVEFEAAYQADPDPVYLFNIAQAYRLDAGKDLDVRLAHIERATFFYRRYLDLAKDAPNRAEVEGRLAALSEERVTTVAAKQALADKLAAERAAAVKVVEPPPPPARPKRVRIAVDVGSSIVFLDGDRQSPQLSGRLLVAYMKHAGDFTFDVGGSWQLTTLPYRDTSGDNVSAGISQLNTIVAATRTIGGPIWGRIGIGVGILAFGNLRGGNPISQDMMPSTDIRVFCARVDSVIGYRYNPTIDFVLGLGSASYARRNKNVDQRLDKFTTVEGLYLGVYIKL
jgi:hypothetical protein